MTALRAERRLPSGVLRPVDFWAFWRLARSFLGETGFLVLGSFFMGHLTYRTSEGLAEGGWGVGKRGKHGDLLELIPNPPKGKRKRTSRK